MNFWPCFLKPPNDLESEALTKDKKKMAVDWYIEFAPEMDSEFLPCSLTGRVKPGNSNLSTTSRGYKHGRYHVGGGQ